jgi:hypothetical protein
VTVRDSSGLNAILRRRRRLSFLALSSSSRTKIKRNKLLNVVDGQIIRLCKQRACALEPKVGGQQVLAPPVVLSLGLGLQNCRARMASIQARRRATGSAATA